MSRVSTSAVARNLYGVETSGLGGSVVAMSRLREYFPVATKQETYLVWGVKEPFFDVLNGNRVFLLSGRIDRIKRYSNRQPVLDSNKKVIMEHVPVPAESSAVLSTMEVRMQDKIVGGRIVKEHVPSKGFLYIDSPAVASGASRCFRYLIPSKYLFPIRFGAVCVSRTRLQKHLGGCGLRTRDNERLYVFIVPYKAQPISALAGERVSLTQLLVYISEDMTALTNYSSQICQWLFSAGIIMDYTLRDSLGNCVAYEVISPTMTAKLGVVSASSSF